MAGDWRASSGGGAVAVTDGRDIWLGRIAGDSPPAFEQLERGLFPAEPVCAVATDGRYLVTATGHVELDDSDPSSRDTALTLLDLEHGAVVARRAARHFGHVGIVGDVVLTWFWYAQGDLLEIQAVMDLGGTPVDPDADAFGSFMQCDMFAVGGDLLIGSTYYKKLLHVGGINAPARDVPLPVPYKHTTSWPYLGFDHQGRPVYVPRGGRDRESWRLDEADRWQRLGRWERSLDAVAEYVGADGRLQSITRAHLRG